jgi:hypothetical protein
MSVLNLYPTVRPTLSFDFVNAGVLDPSVTFTRPTSATYFDETGILRVANPNTPRLDFNPSTLAAQGLLIEEQRTNLVLRSEDFATTWSPQASSITSNSSTAPNGTVTMDTLVENAALAQHFVEQSLSGLTASATYTATVFVKFPSNNRRFVLQITDAASGGTGFASTEVSVSGAFISATTTGSFTNASGSSTSVGGGIFRVVLTATISTITSIRFRCILADSAGVQNYTGDGVSGVFLWGAQLEAGAFPTSYIPTTTTALTRSADVASVNTLSPWYNASAGTLYAEYNIPFALTSGASSRLAALLGAGGAAVDDLSLFISQPSGRAASANAFTGSVNAGRIDASASFAANTTTKATYAYASNDRAVTTGGSSPTISTAAYTIPTVTLMRLGSQDGGGTNNINGYLRRIAYYPLRLSNAQLQNLTA